MNISKQEYAELNKKASPNSSFAKNCTLAFVIGGLICALAEFLCWMFMDLEMIRLDAAPLASAALIIIAVILTGCNVFDALAKHAGAGTLVPITGFANSMVSPAIEFKSEGFITGLGAKMFSIAGPVLVYGISASVIYGVIVFIISLFK